ASSRPDRAPPARSGETASSSARVARARSARAVVPSGPEAVDTPAAPATPRIVPHTGSRAACPVTYRSQTSNTALATVAEVTRRAPVQPPAAGVTHVIAALG